MSPKPARDVANTLKLLDWLKEHVGGSDLPGFFKRDIEVVYVPRLDEDGYLPLTPHKLDHDGPAQVRVADAHIVRAVLADQYQCVKIRKLPDGNIIEVPHLPSLDAFTTFIASAVAGATSLLPLEGVSHTPFMRADGTVCDRPGYDGASRTLYLPPRDLVVPPVPEYPTTEQRTDAGNLILDLLSDFKWVDDGDLVTYIGAVLLAPLMRPRLKPPYPAVCITAPQASSGKTLLGQVAGDLHGIVFRSEPSSSDEELRKQLTSILGQTSAPLVMFDNVAGVIRSARFCTLFTSRTHSDRPLGSSDEVEYANDRVWILGGNNIALGAEMPRRVVWVRLNVDAPDPHLRSGFKYADLRGHVQANRGSILNALLTIARGWVIDGSPVAGPSREDTHGPWLRAMAGVLQQGGFVGTFADPAVAATASAVPSEDDDGGAFLAALATAFPEDWFTTRDVVQLVTTAHTAAGQQARRDGGDNWASGGMVEDRGLALLDALPEVLEGKGGSPIASSRTVGRWFMYRTGRWMGGHVLRSGRDPHTKVSQFRVESR